MKTYALPTKFVPIAGHLPGMFLATVVNSRSWNTSLTLPTPRPAQLISGVQGASLQGDAASLTCHHRCECGFPPLASQLQLRGGPLACDPFRVNSTEESPPQPGGTAK